MANQPHPDKQPVTWRLHRDLVSRVRAAAAANGETVLALVARALEREVSRDAAPSLDAADIRRDTYRAPGQLVHEGPRGITLTHLPTGLVASSHSERSGVENVASAYAELRRLVAGHRTAETD